jgi:hypothetical protein
VIISKQTIKTLWTLQEKREVGKIQALPPKMDPIKGASYVSNRKETQTSGRIQEVMRAAEKAQ